MDTHPLKNLLQLQLGSDRNAILHLPHIISTLDAVALQPSPHTQKWTARINSLVLSKDSGARWAGLCIAFQTAAYSRDLMMECAQPWVTTALPMLSVRTVYSLVIDSASSVCTVSKRKTKHYQL